MLTNSSTQIQQIANILTGSFLDEPSFSFVFGDNSPHQISDLKAFFEILVTDALERGKIYIAPEEQGA